MKRGGLLAGVAVAALLATGYRYLRPDTDPPTMRLTGEHTDEGLIVRRKTIDYQAVIAEAAASKASLLTMTVTREIVRNQQLSDSIRFTPFPASTALIRVRYRVEYPIGYLLSPGTFRVAGGASGLTITLHRPRLVARPSVRLLSYAILERGILIDEKSALLELQQRIEPEAERLAGDVLTRSDVVPTSERALRALIVPFLRRAGDGADPPPITFDYR